jgi:hypothetical protein
MTETVVIGKHRYHLETELADNDICRVYRAFYRRRSGNVIKRRYYAVFTPSEDADESAFNVEMRRSLLTVPFPTYTEDDFEADGRRYVVIAKGVKEEGSSKRWQSLQNHGYLMLFLAAFIIILLIIRFFQ